MKQATVQVRELAAWGYDEYPYRPTAFASPANAYVKQRPAYVAPSPLLQSINMEYQEALRSHESRPELLTEMIGLDWTLGIVDLRQLLAFQRRLVFNFGAPQRVPPDANNWARLIDFCFPPPEPVTCQTDREGDGTYILRSQNPNLHARIGNNPARPVELQCGSPFLEVAQYNGRWFLRDGYHRAYALLRNNVQHVPAVIVRAKTLAELGATRPWFFPEDILFSPQPPRITDFLNDKLTIRYDRSSLTKTIRITIEESFHSIGELS